MFLWYTGAINNQIAGIPPANVWYKFNEGSGTTAIDSGSGGYDGTYWNRISNSTF